ALLGCSLLRLPPPPPSTLFPYTTLFRSARTGTQAQTPAAEHFGTCITLGCTGIHIRFHAHATSPPHADSVRPRLGRHRPCARSGDRKSTRLNSSHVKISYAVFCLKKKKK